MKVIVNETEQVIHVGVSSGGSGVPGPAGNGIESITLISTIGLEKTYQILFTDGTTYNYVVTDGSSGADTPDQTAAVYVSKIGDDVNSGTNPFEAKLTFSAAITTASALITAGATGVRIEVQDGGTYTDASIEIPENVHLVAQAATFIGQVEINANATFYIDKHFASANNEKCVQHAGGASGAAIYFANILDGRGVSGTLTGVKNIRNVGGGGKNLFVRVGILYVTTDGVGIGDVSSGDAGHIHFLCPDIYLAGNNSVGILGSAQGAGSSNIVGYSDHILEIGSPTGTVGIRMNAAGAAVKATATEIIADTAYDITAGSLYLSCQRIIGTRTGTPVNRMIGTEDFPDLLESTELESNTILFDKDYVIGNAAPRTGNVLFDFTGAKLGSSTMMIHADASAFTLPAESVILSGTASDTVTNYIYFLLVNTASGAEKVHVTISQEVI